MFTLAFIVYYLCSFSFPVFVYAINIIILSSSAAHSIKQYLTVRPRRFYIVYNNIVLRRCDEQYWCFTRIYVVISCNDTHSRPRNGLT